MNTTSPALIDPTPAREHLAKLRAAGYTYAALAERTGLPVLTWQRLAAGANDRVRPDTAAAVLAVPVPNVVQLPADLTDSTGTRRRVQALMRVGWPIPQIADAADLNRKSLDHALTCPTVRPSTAAAVASAYDALWDQRPDTSTRFLLGGSNRTRRRAEAEGWPPPAAWDDDEIDNPAASEPVDVVADPAESSSLDLDEWLFLVRNGEHPERAAARFDVSLAAVEKAAAPDRHDRPDVLAELRVARAAARRWRAETWAA